MSVAQNFSARGGEIDLVMREANTLVFVEVRQRKSDRFGGARGSIDARKQARIERAVEAYLARLPQRAAFRVDAVLFDGERAPEWVKNVFA